MISPTRTVTTQKNPWTRDVKLLQEIEEETTRILSPLFSDTVWLNRAHLLLKGEKSSLNECRFKSLVLVLNGRIKQCLRIFCDVRSLNVAKIFSLILELDNVISEGMKLPRTPSLDHFQSYAKGMLLRNIGDTLFLLHNSNRRTTTFEELYYASYIIAFDIFHKTSPASPLLSAIFVLEALILNTLLNRFGTFKLSNATMQQQVILTFMVGERLYKACNGMSTMRYKSFMVSLNTIPYNHEMDLMEQNEIGRLVMLAGKDDVLTNLLWLMAYNKEIRNNAFFLDPFIKNIPSGTSDNDLQSFTELSLSGTDVKVLLLSAAEWTKLSSYSGQGRDSLKMVILPPILFVQPSYMMRKFWDLILTIARDDTHRSILHCSNTRLILSALEASRLRGEIPDVRIVDSVRKWLIAHGNALGDIEGSWAKLYSRVFMDVVNGVHHGNQGVLAEDSFFPQLSDSPIRSDYDMFESSELWCKHQKDSAAQKDVKFGHLVGRSWVVRSDDLSASDSSRNISLRQSFLQRLRFTAKSFVNIESYDLLLSPSTSKNETIKALKNLIKVYEEKHKIDTHRVPEENGHLEPSSITGNSQTEDVYIQIAKLQNEHAWDIYRILQIVNSLQERIKQNTTELNIYCSIAYRQGYGDGYYAAALQDTVHSTDPVESLCSHSGFLNSQGENSGMILKNQVHGPVQDIEYPHNPKECFGCASEEEQIRILRILDRLADDDSHYRSA